MCSNQYESVSTWLYFFTSQLCFCLETERKFTQVAYDNIQQDGKIHIEVPENYSFTEKNKINCSYNNLVIEMTFNGGRTWENGLLPSFVFPSVRTSNTFGISGLSPVSCHPKKSSAASSRALSVLVPPRICGSSTIFLFNSPTLCGSLNL